MDTRQLKTFRTVAKNLSFSKTAEELNYAQSDNFCANQVIGK